MTPLLDPPPGAVLLAAAGLLAHGSGGALAETEGVLVDPGPPVYVTELGDFSVNFTVYFWTGSEQANVLRVSDRVATRIKLALDEAGIEIPYPRTVAFLRGGGTDEGEAPR